MLLSAVALGTALNVAPAWGQEPPPEAPPAPPTRTVTGPVPAGVTLEALPIPS